jgi:hypothetical protein
LLEFTVLDYQVTLDVVFFGWLSLQLSQLSSYQVHYLAFLLYNKNWNNSVKTYLVCVVFGLGTVKCGKKIIVFSPWS